MLEVCVDTIDGAMAALKGGAGRIELCSSLSEGGLTPSAGLMRLAATLPIPCYAMIRPRCGLFHYTREEVEIMVSDIAVARDAGLAGVVLGAQSSNGSLHEEIMRRLVLEAGPLGKTLHRVIDVVPDPLQSLEQAIDLGFERVLTSGAKPLAPDGLSLIRQMVIQAKQRLSVMPGCGLTPENVKDVLDATGATEAHASCRLQIEGQPAFSDFDPPSGRSETSQDEVARMVTAIAQRPL